MTDEKKVERYVTIPGRKGLVRVLISKRPVVGASGGANGAGGAAGGGPDGNAPQGGYLPPSRLADDDIPYQVSPYIYVYDLGVQLAQAGGTPEYVDLKGLLPVVAGSYSPSDRKAYEDKLLGRLLSNNPAQVSPFDTTTIVQSGRKAPVVWPWSTEGMGNLNPQVIPELKPGAEFVPSPFLSTTTNWKQVTPANENWAASNTAFHLAPNYTYWRIPAQGRVRHLRLTDFRYQNWDTDDVARYKITGEPLFGATEVEFKINWPVKIYIVPWLLWPSEGFGATVRGFVNRTVVQVVGTGIQSGKPYQDQLVTRTNVTVPQTGLGPTSFFNESSLYPMARYPLVGPRPWRGTAGGGWSASDYTNQYIGLSALKVRRSHSFTFRKVVSWTLTRVISGLAGIQLGSGSTSTERTAQNVQEFAGRRTLALAADILAAFKAAFEPELLSEFGVGSMGALSGPLTSISLTYNVNNAAPAAYSPVQARVGQLCAIVRASGRTYYVWRK